MKGSDPAKGVWLFQPAGKPKRMVIFFHGQGGPEEATPANHRAWIDHMVDQGSVVIYPLRTKLRGRGARIGDRRRADGARAAGQPGSAGARDRLLARRCARRRIRRGRGGEGRARAGHRRKRQHGRVRRTDGADRSQVARARHDDRHPCERPGSARGGRCLRAAQAPQASGFPGTQIELNFACSHGSFTADHLAPLEQSPNARRAYWDPTDALRRQLAS